MYILGIDTATRVAGAAVMGADRLISEHFIHNLKTHSQKIIPMIQQVMDEAGIKPGDLHGIAVTGGPGSFTGLRIGMSVAKTMGQVLNVPVIGISTLKVLAWNMFRVKGYICPILDARKNEVYTSVYQSVSDGLKELINPSAISIHNLLTELSGYNETVTFIGDGVPVYSETIKKSLGERAAFGTRVNSFPRASAVAELGLLQLQEGRVSDPTFLQPIYLRKSEAELTWEEKNSHK